MTAWIWTHFLGTHDSVPLAAGFRSRASRHRAWTTWLVIGIYAGCLAAFVADLRSADTLAFGVFYVPLVATAVFRDDRRAVWVLTAIACTMVIVGAFFPDIATNVRDMVWNRGLSICAIVATALFVRHARAIQDQLAGQTRRAEAAERIKSDVLLNLSQEIRAPLHSMISVLELVAADSRADHKPALSMIRTSGRRLASTVDNLVDLTQFDDPAMPAEPVDLALLLHQVIEANRPDARARQIALTIDLSTAGDAQVFVNPWGLRRILENKIADAIANTPPGGRIDIGIEPEPDHRTLVIDMTGTWPPGAFDTAADADRALLMPAVMGLALSRRLARAMGARLTFDSGPDGTTVRLQLPAAPQPRAECA